MSSGQSSIIIVGLAQHLYMSSLVHGAKIQTSCSHAHTLHCKIGIVVLHEATVKTSLSTFNESSDALQTETADLAGIPQLSGHALLSLTLMLHFCRALGNETAGASVSRLVLCTVTYCWQDISSHVSLSDCWFVLHLAL